MINSAEYWEGRYVNSETGWDRGRVSPPLKAYFDQLQDKSIDLLIPGSGNGYEAEYLFNKGFKNIYVADIALSPLKNLAKRIPQFPKENMMNINFFEIEKKFDLIIEQTFFCALPPAFRLSYAEKMQQLLKPKAKLVGILFDFPLTELGPPFGGRKEEYVNLFKDKFQIHKLERCYNSFPKLSGKELFINFENKP
jgi:thiopurine S-methyltransferase